MKKIFRFLFGWITSIFQSLGKVADKVLPVVISVTNEVKAIVENPVTDIITAITPTGLDDVIVAKIRKVLPDVLRNMTLAQEFLHLQTPEAILKALGEKLRQSETTEWQKFWVDFAGMLTYYLADGKLSVGEAISLAQYWYHNKPEV